jgi:glycogen debranching enzyme
MGPFVSAWVRVHGARRNVRRRAAVFYRGLENHLDEAGLGTVSEIFDGDPPHAARGCIAQAWSVGELLRSYVEDVLGICPRHS